MALTHVQSTRMRGSFAADLLIIIRTYLHMRIVSLSRLRRSDVHVDCRLDQSHVIVVRFAKRSYASGCKPNVASPHLMHTLVYVRSALALKPWWGNARRCGILPRHGDDMEAESCGISLLK